MFVAADFVLGIVCALLTDFETLCVGFAAPIVSGHQQLISSLSSHNWPFRCLDWKIMENLIIISKVGGKLWRREGFYFPEILSISELIMRAIFENMIGPDYISCYTDTPRVLGIPGKEWCFLNLQVKRRRPFCGFWNFHSLFVTSNFNVTYCLPKKINFWDW